VTDLQLLPPRQLAVLILRDVLGFHAKEVADMLDTTVESVNSALKRARASMQRRRIPATDREPAPAANSHSEDAILNKFVSAWESADLDSLVALLTDDVFISSWPVSAPASSARAGGSTACEREPTVSRRLEPTFAPRLA
jgi:Sigma-70, region 4